MLCFKLQLVSIYIHKAYLLPMNRMELKVTRQHYGGSNRDDGLGVTMERRFHVGCMGGGVEGGWRRDGLFYC